MNMWLLNSEDIAEYELVSLNKLKEDKMYLKKNENIRNEFSKSYIYFRGEDILIRSQEINTYKNEQTKIILKINTNLEN